MFEYYSLLVATCEGGSDAGSCWIETAVQVLEGEKKEEAFEFLESIGWEFQPDNSCICPYCSKGIRQERAEKTRLRRVK